MELEGILEQGRQIAVLLDAFPVVRLGEQFYQERHA
jgi:hypothetical protein